MVVYFANSITLLDKFKFDLKNVISNKKNEEENLKSKIKYIIDFIDKLNKTITNKKFGKIDLTIGGYKNGTAATEVDFTLALQVPEEVEVEFLKKINKEDFNSSIINSFKKDLVKTFGLYKEKELFIATPTSFKPIKDNLQNKEEILEEIFNISVNLQNDDGFTIYFNEKTPKMVELDWDKSFLEPTYSNEFVLIDKQDVEFDKLTKGLRNKENLHLFKSKNSFFILDSIKKEIVKIKCKKNTYCENELLIGIQKHLNKFNFSNIIIPTDIVKNLSPTVLKQQQLFIGLDGNNKEIYILFDVRIDNIKTINFEKSGFGFKKIKEFDLEDKRLKFG